MSDILKNLPTINFVRQESLEILRDSLGKKGFRVFQMDGTDVKDARSFFKKIVNVFPQDPPLSGKCNWDAFTDSLWGGLDELAQERVAFIWTRVEKMFEFGIPDLFTAIECFKDVASSVSNPEYGISKPVELYIFLVGNGQNFKLFENRG
jgi:hypothetical protein